MSIFGRRKPDNTIGAFNGTAVLGELNSRLMSMGYPKLTELLDTDPVFVRNKADNQRNGEDEESDLRYLQYLVVHLISILALRPRNGGHALSR